MQCRSHLSACHRSTHRPQARACRICSQRATIFPAANANLLAVTHSRRHAPHACEIASLRHLRSTAAACRSILARR